MQEGNGLLIISRMRPDYKQPHSIKDYRCVDNRALREHLVLKEHCRQKYEDNVRRMRRVRRD